MYMCIHDNSDKCMADEHKLLPCDGFNTLTRLCTDLDISFTDVWVPLEFFASTRGKKDAAVLISPSTPIVLLNHSTGKLLKCRDDILARLHLLIAEGQEEFFIPTTAAPAGCTLFVRAAKNMAKKHLKKGTFVLYRSVTDEQIIAEGSAVCVDKSLFTSQKQRKRGLEGPGSAVDDNTAEKKLHAAVERQRRRTEADALFDKYLQKIMENTCGKSLGHSDVIIKKTLANIIRVCDAMPLHFVIRGQTQNFVKVKGLLWNVPDRRVMYRIFRHGDVSDAKINFTYTDAARLIAVFMVDSVLVRRKVVPTSSNEDLFQSWSLVDPDLPAVIHKLAEKGYRIVFFEHYSSIHHGNLMTLETKLVPIAELCRQYFTCDVTVFLSTMSHISASKRSQGTGFIPPNSGVWHFFTAQLNGGLRADANSLLVGQCLAGEEDRITSAFSHSGRNKQFALNCGLCYLDCEELKKKVLHA